MNIAELTELAHDVRDVYRLRGWKTDQCAIGRDGVTCLLASDTGAIEYTFLSSGVVRREHRGCPDKLVEFVDLDLQKAVTEHNMELRN